MVEKRVNSNMTNENQTKLQTFQAKDLRSFTEIVSQIHYYASFIRSAESHSKDIPPQLWYRGLTQDSYHLLPSFYFPDKEVEGTKHRYDESHLREDLRLHEFTAKAYHHIHTFPDTNTDWYEIMQHHFVRTRFMDWTETAIAALAFAVEPFLMSDDKNTQYKRLRVKPIVWVMEPSCLNKCVYDAFLKQSGTSYPLLEQAIPDSYRGKLPGKSQDFVRKIFNLLSESSDAVDRFLGNPQSKSLIDRPLINLSQLETDCVRLGNRLPDAVVQGAFNPFHYLLYRYYCERVPVPEGQRLPPLATIQPYHSERISAQHGAFTCFPHYMISESDKTLKVQLDIDTRAMDYQRGIAHCLYKIRILDPEKTAMQLKEIGIRRSHLYPDMENISKDLEMDRGVR
jgi:hypothetical protein